MDKFTEALKLAGENGVRVRVEDWGQGSLPDVIIDGGDDADDVFVLISREGDGSFEIEPMFGSVPLPKEEAPEWIDAALAVAELIVKGS